MTIHHLARLHDWTRAVEDGEYRTSTLGLTLDEVGFIHASYAQQLAGTAERFYAEETGPLVVLDIDEAGLDVREEGGFPHVYGPIPVAAVERVVPARMTDGRLVTG